MKPGIASCVRITYRHPVVSRELLFLAHGAASNELQKGYRTGVQHPDPRLREDITFVVVANSIQIKRAGQGHSATHRRGWQRATQLPAQYEMMTTTIAMMMTTTSF